MFLSRRRTVLFAAFTASLIAASVLSSAWRAGAAKPPDAPAAAPARFAAITWHDMVRARAGAGQAMGHISIPRLGISIPVVPVGLGPDGGADIPPDPAQAGWFALGPHPGERGNAAIVGLVRDRMGWPGAFHGLEALEPGDDIEVEDGGGRKLRFRVVRRERYDPASMSAREIFGSGETPRLNLVAAGARGKSGAPTREPEFIVWSELR